MKLNVKLYSRYECLLFFRMVGWRDVLITGISSNFSLMLSACLLKPCKITALFYTSQEKRAKTAFIFEKRLRFDS